MLRFPGDGIGTEVIRAGIEVLKVTAARDGGFVFDIETFGWGTDYYLEHGRMMPADGLSQLAPFDAIYFGSAGDPRVPDHISLWGLRLAICQPFDQYANVRPSRLLPGIRGPLRDVGEDDLDWVIVRENTEGEYAGAGGRVHRGHGEEVGMDVAVFTRTGVERIQRFALELARTRPAKHLTLVTKSNAQRHGMVMWDDVFEEIKTDYADVKTDKMLVDAMTTRMVLDPKIAGRDRCNQPPCRRSERSRGCALRQRLALRRPPTSIRSASSLRCSSRFTARPSTSWARALPIRSATFWSAVMMLDHLGESRAANSLMQAIERYTAAGRHFSRDLGGSATTEQVTAAVIDILEGRND